MFFVTSSIICHHGSFQMHRVLLRLISCFPSEPRPQRVENAVNVLPFFRLPLTESPRSISARQRCSTQSTQPNKRRWTSRAGKPPGSLDQRHPALLMAYRRRWGGIEAVKGARGTRLSVSTTSPRPDLFNVCLSLKYINK